MFNTEEFIKEKNKFFQKYSNEAIIELLGVSIVLSFNFFGNEKAALLLYKGYYFELFYDDENNFPSRGTSLTSIKTTEDFKTTLSLFRQILEDRNRKENLLVLFERLIYSSNTGDGSFSRHKEAEGQAYRKLAQTVKELIIRG